MGEETYTVVDVNGRGNGGIMTMPDEDRQTGVKPHWLVHVAVHDTKNLVTRARELGAKVKLPPTAIPMSGASPSWPTCRARFSP